MGFRVVGSVVRALATVARGPLRAVLPEIWAKVEASVRSSGCMGLADEEAVWIICWPRRFSTSLYVAQGAL